ncbi:hypothetical protein P3S67_013229 [Capsicum chacoense]
MFEKMRDNENQNIEEKEQQDIFDDRLDDLDMNFSDDDQTPTSVDATNMVGNFSWSTQSGNFQDEGIDFFNGIVFCYKCANLNCKWWLRAVKYVSFDRFVIHKHEKHRTCGSENISSKNPHATAKVLYEYFKSCFPDGKDPSTKVMANQLLTELGVLVSYWKIYMAMGIAKDLVRETHEHGYAVLDAYCYMIESTNLGSF